ADVDHVAVEPAAKDVRFIGRTETHSVELTFERRLDDGQPVLLFDGWIEYPYSQTMFAAWQAGAEFAAPTLEAADEHGQWHVVAEQFGYMAGMPRESALPLDTQQLPPGCRKLRLSSNLEIYWDRIAVAFAEEPAEIQRHEYPLVSAAVAERGFAQRTTFAQHRPYYDDRRCVPLWDTRHLRGNYTQLGEALPLASAVDDAVIVFGPGEEVELTFAAPPPESNDSSGTVDGGATQRFVLELNGWCKDMDLYTRDGETVAPLPRRATTDSPTASDAIAVERDREKLHAEYNTRFRAGH
ncbi:MAG: hypothetical protein KDA71_15360, partial [Planctomycetales bacterium]|nr:hypothetical protein [Planctomycetales bacterium]